MKKGPQKSGLLVKNKVSMKSVKSLIEGKNNKKNSEVHEQIIHQRSPATHAITNKQEKRKQNSKFIYTGIEGFDKLLDDGIPKGSSIVIAGGAGTGKTIFSLQTLNYHATKGKKCLYMSFEEQEQKLIQHMEDFGWKPKNLIKAGYLNIVRMNPFDITRNVDALLAKQKGELLIDVDPVIFPKNFKPEIIIIDSLTSVGSAFINKGENYRIYLEQLFRFLEKSTATSFLITETEQIPKMFSTTGAEEFLADGVIVLYAIKHDNIRENAIEILKLRGAKHKKQIVAMRIGNNGIEVFPEQEIFSEM